MESGQDPQKELEERVRRIQEALSHLPAAVSHVAAGLAAAGLTGDAVKAGVRGQRRALREQLREEKRQRKLDRDRRREEEEGLPHALAFAAGSAATFYYGLRNPAFFWMVFVGFGLAMAAAGSFTRWARRHRAAEAGRVEVEVVRPAPLAQAPPAPPPSAAELSPRVAAISVREARVDAVCDKLLDELRTSPEAVRQMIRKPEETVQALRSASHELARRERELRLAAADADEERLRTERAELEARIAAEPDDVVKLRLASALEALDAQIRGRGDLLVLAARIEAEGTRILYSLESLRAQVLRTRVADAASADVAGDGLRHGLEQLSREMDAVATALEEVHTPEAAPRRMPVPLPMRQ